jgi:phosphate transport system substrate-binding protein
VKKIMIALPLAAAVAACGSNGGGDNAGGEGAAKQAIKVVGSSTVYPFTTAVAEQFQRDNPNVSVVARA